MGNEEILQRLERLENENKSLKNALLKNNTGEKQSGFCAAPDGFDTPILSNEQLRQMAIVLNTKGRTPKKEPNDTTKISFF